MRSQIEKPVAPIIAAPRERLRLTDEEVVALIDLSMEEDNGVYDGYDWDEDCFDEWLTEQVWNYVSPSYKRIRRIQKEKGWTFDN
jgi:hypothetical protein